MSWGCMRGERRDEDREEKEKKREREEEKMNSYSFIEFLRNKQTNEQTKIAVLYKYYISDRENSISILSSIIATISFYDN